MRGLLGQNADGLNWAVRQSLPLIMLCPMTLWPAQYSHLEATRTLEARLSTLLSNFRVSCVVHALNICISVHLFGLIISIVVIVAHAATLPSLVRVWSINIALSEMDFLKFSMTSSLLDRRALGLVHEACEVCQLRTEQSVSLSV